VVASITNRGVRGSSLIGGLWILSEEATRKLGRAGGAVVGLFTEESSRVRTGNVFASKGRFIER